jgi:kynurenine formamidase
MKRVDITYPLNDAAFKAMAALTPKDKILSQLDLFGHIGTHLDLMGKSYPESYYELSGRVFDVRKISNRDINVQDIDLSLVREKDFIIFNSGCLAMHTYASKEYIYAPVQLAWDLIHALLKIKVAMIGIDFAGVRLPKEHVKADTLCAEVGIFNVENVYALEELVNAVGTSTL